MNQVNTQSPKNSFLIEAERLVQKVAILTNEPERSVYKRILARLSLHYCIDLSSPFSSFEEETDQYMKLYCFAYSEYLYLKAGLE